MISNLDLSREALAYVYQGHYTLTDASHLSTSICRDAAALLCHELLFTDEARLHLLDLGAICDDYMNIDEGYSFMSDARNNFLNLPWVRRCDFEHHNQTTSNIFPHAAASSFLSHGFAADSLYAVQRYEDSVQTFLEYIIVLILLCGGQPDGSYSVDRGMISELVSIRCVNKVGSPRHITVSEGVVCVSTLDVLDPFYSPCHLRMLHKHVSAMIVLYLVCVRPFLASISRSPAATSDYLFPTATGHWDTSTYMDIIRRESELRLGKILELDDINTAQVRLNEKLCRAQPSEALDRLPFEKNYQWSFITKPWAKLASSKLLRPLRTPSPVEFTAETNSSTSSVHSSFSEGTAFLHSAPLSPLNQDAPWSMPSPTLSTASTVFSGSFDLPTEKELIKIKSEQVQSTVKPLEFINATPKELAANFRSHGADGAHQLCFVSVENNDQLRKKSSRSTGSSVGPQRRPKANSHGSAWDRFTQAFANPPQQGQRGRPRKSTTLRSLL